MKSSGKICIVGALLVFLLPCVFAKKFTVPPLSYNYSSYEPVIDTQTMILHHTKHFQAYTGMLLSATFVQAQSPRTQALLAHNLNAAVQKLSNDLVDLDALSLARRIAREENGEVSRSVGWPDEVTRWAIRNNAGGYVNHAIYFKLLRPPNPIKPQNPSPSSKLGEAIIKQYSTFDAFKSEFAAAAMSVFGSGWVFLAFSAATSAIKILQTGNQDIPEQSIPEPRLDAILALDVWEHAYYLKYNNRRIEYVQQWFTIVDWDVAESLYEDAVDRATKHDEL
ncbi:hypothetical protein SmJEL517_g00159 [Synchytrium microbalum]|uniref:superoxide dismutase n=1 Tax=Synchytrium microbalum TaxID=1806994 RepID=A0A507CFF8_9FUNG|nr:uncharacterized protein SmJEL517_g00159 [Synchytrium microbalum]TPX38362.1 hypothetical protein SmJEL517_g00159 [Synchytrium microbalum]